MSDAPTLEKTLSPMASSKALCEAKTADDSNYVLRVPIYSSMTDEKDRIKPDVVLKLIDVAGCVPVKRHLGSELDPVTASIDRMDFLGPVHPWEILILDSRMTRVWNTSMESRVVVTAWSFRTGESRAIANAYMVTVATSQRGMAKAKPEDIPALKNITPEDRMLQRSADVRKEYRKFEQSRTSFTPIVDEEDDPVVVDEPMTRDDSNGLGQNVFGGVIISQVYVTAQKAMKKHVGTQNFVCVRQDRMDFLQPALIGETLRSKAVVTKTWKSSVEVQVECLAVSPDTNEERHVATTYFVFVHLDEVGKPSMVTPWTPESPRQQERAKAADLRRRLREDEQKYLGDSI